MEEADSDERHRREDRGVSNGLAHDGGDHGALPSVEMAPDATLPEVRDVSRGPSDDSAAASAGDSSMDCDIVSDEHDLEQFLNLHGQRRAARQAARGRFEDMIFLVSSLGHGGKSYR